MNSINKQKFIAELGRLLTFMYDEDRQTALAMYSKMFDDADNEQALMQFLVSPTRQAVVLARAYNAKERKLQVHAQPRSILEGEEPDVLPEFILAIDQIQQEAAELAGESVAVDPDQLTLFADDAHPQPDAVAAEPARQAQEREPEMNETAQTTPADILAKSTEEEAESATSELERIKKTAPVDEVDAFMESFTIKDESLYPEESEENEYDVPVATQTKSATERSPKTFLLILYIILAIPMTLIGVALLLVPTLLFLALAGVAIIGGCIVFSAAFSGFAVFADIMVVLGGALVILAIGLLLLWTFVWFIGGAIVGFINSVIRLGGKWCYKEEVLSA